ncbi:MAG: class I SAM-dependent methyltransferase [Lachnospiraceae bacterium]|nr:class I SAM-dependent methyltransferase [Lachnospiraceae bacterium]
MKKIVIWGAGGMAEGLANCFEPSKAVVTAYVDSDPDKWGTKICDIEIIAPEMLSETEYDLIFISSVKYQREILTQLLGMGVERKQIISAVVTYVEMAKIMDIVSEKGMIYLSYVASNARENLKYKTLQNKVDTLSSTVKKNFNNATNQLKHAELKRYYEEDAVRFLRESFVEGENAPGRQVLFEDRSVYFDYVIDSLSYKDGLYLEFGVYKGHSINYVADRIDGKTIYGFDCFEGLPEDWLPGCKKTTLDVQGELPKVRSNVELVKGLFDETLPGFLEKHKGEMCSYIHIDCDLYSSTKYVLTTLKEHIGKGTVICFDEFVGHIGWRDDEYKAFMEFIEETGYKYKYVAGCSAVLYCRTGERVAIEIL